MERKRTYFTIHFGSEKQALGAQLLLAELGLATIRMDQKDNGATALTAFTQCTQDQLTERHSEISKELADMGTTVYTASKLPGEPREPIYAN